MIIAEVLRFEQFVKVCLHQCLHNVSNKYSKVKDHLTSTHALENMKNYAECNEVLLGWALLMEHYNKDTHPSWRPTKVASRCPVYQ